MEKQQAFEWAEAQKIVITTDLIAAAKNQLHFLEIVDGNRHLYNGPALDKAILRYKNCWLPLLAKHAESKFPQGQLVVPLDCEWIWHCHRLNPVRYITDCKELFGRILDIHNVVSSTQGTCTKTTEKIWKLMYKEEPYELNIASENKMVTFSSTNYDLISAVKRQTTFFYQVSRSYMKDNMYLEGAVERYKGFLHLIRRKAEKKSRSFYVPTYDIDLIWHSHQLNPVSYGKNLRAIVGNVLEHDDSDSNKDKGGKLDTGFRQTTKQWEDLFGLRYWRAGAMYRGPAPSPLSFVPQLETILSKKLSPDIEYRDIVKLPTLMLVEVLLDIVEVENIPVGNKDSLTLGVSKKTPDFFFKTRRNLRVSLEAEVKQVVCFQCEPTGDLTFELTSYFPSDSKLTKRSHEVLGTTSVSLQDLLNSSGPKLSVQKWFEFKPAAGTVCSVPISFNIAISVTPPVPGPYKLTMDKGYPIPRNMSSFPLPKRVEKTQKWTVVLDEAGNEVFSILMRDRKKLESGNISSARKEVYGMTKSAETYLLAEFIGDGWIFIGSQWFLPFQKNGGEDEYIFELLGSKKMIMFRGRKLGYEIKNGNKKENEDDFMTLVEFSSENPYGKSVALLNVGKGFLEVEEKRLVLPAITLAFILSDILTIKKDGYDNDLLATREKKGENWCDEYEEHGGGGDENMKSYCGLLNVACLGSDCGIGCSGTCSAGCSSPCTSSCMSK